MDGIGFRRRNRDRDRDRFRKRVRNRNGTRCLGFAKDGHGTPNRRNQSGVCHGCGLSWMMLLLPLMLVATTAPGACAEGQSLTIPLHHMPRTRAQDRAVLRQLHDSHNHAIEQRESAANGKGREAYVIPMENIKNSQYVGQIGVGTPPQHMSIILDTGSSNLWVTSTGCTSPQCRSHPRYDPGASSSHKVYGLDVKVKFGTGSISGFISTETFSLGPMRVVGQAFGEITQEIGAVFQSSHFSGILGLAFPALSAYDFTPVFDNIMLQRLLKRPQIAFHYSIYPAQDSAVIFGDVDHSYYEGDIEWVPVSRQFYWESVLTDVEVNGQRQHLCDSGGPGNEPDGDDDPAYDSNVKPPPHQLHKGCRIVFDTGTTLVTGPSSAVGELLRHLHLDPDCAGKEDLPSLSFLVHGHRWTLDPEDYVIEAHGSPAEHLGDNHGSNTPSAPRTCKIGMMALDVPPPRGPLWILGDLFMRKYLTVFDRERARIGVAKSRHQHPTTTVSQESAPQGAGGKTKGWNLQPSSHHSETASPAAGYPEPIASVSQPMGDVEAGRKPGVVFHDPHAHPPVLRGVPLHGFMSPDGNTVPEIEDTSNLFAEVPHDGGAVGSAQAVAQSLRASDSRLLRSQHHR